MDSIAQLHWPPAIIDAPKKKRLTLPFVMGGKSLGPKLTNSNQLSPAWKKKNEVCFPQTDGDH